MKDRNYSSRISSVVTFSVNKVSTECPKVSILLLLSSVAHFYRSGGKTLRAMCSGRGVVQLSNFVMPLSVVNLLACKIIGVAGTVMLRGVL